MDQTPDKQITDAIVRVDAIGGMLDDLARCLRRAHQPILADELGGYSEGLREAAADIRAARTAKLDAEYDAARDDMGKTLELLVRCSEGKN